MTLKIGDRVGRLTLLKEKTEKGRKYFWCRCDCGNEKWIRADGIGKVVSCGCYNREHNIRYSLDITGKKFGKLTPIRLIGKSKSGGCIWECRCDCGNITKVSLNNLKSGNTTSCGCYMKEVNSKSMKEHTKPYINSNFIEGTNIDAIKKNKPLRNSTTGIRGVSYNAKNHKYLAQIEFKGKHYNLGRFDTKEEAKEAYEKAKEELHNKFLKEHEASK